MLKFPRLDICYDNIIDICTICFEEVTGCFILTYLRSCIGRLSKKTNLISLLHCFIDAHYISSQSSSFALS